jgi:hypothetical protein
LTAGILRAVAVLAAAALVLAALTAIIPESTFPGLIGGQVVDKLFFVVAGAFVYLYLFLSVPGSFAIELELLDEHRGLAVLVPAIVVLVLAVVVRLFCSKLRSLWGRAKQGGAILGDRRAFTLKVLAPELGAWLYKLAAPRRTTRRRRARRGDGHIAAVADPVRRDLRAAGGFPAA